jgi:hypothetical protein
VSPWEGCELEESNEWSKIARKKLYGGELTSGFVLGLVVVVEQLLHLFLEEVHGGEVRLSTC